MITTCISQATNDKHPVQLHGKEAPAECEILMPRVIKAIRVRDEQSLDCLGAYAGKSAGFVLDTFSQEREGGTGVEDFVSRLAERGLRGAIVPDLPPEGAGRISRPCIGAGFPPSSSSPPPRPMSEWRT